MRYEDTVCYSIERATTLLQKLQKGENISLGEIAGLLRSAQNKVSDMEQGLKKRKKIMIATGLEEAYQKSKNKSQEGIRTIGNINEPRKEKDIHTEIIIKDLVKNEIIYHKKGHAGVFAMVEDIENLFDHDGVTHGKVQTFYFGNPLAWIFALDQLRRMMQPHMIQVQEYVSKYYPDYLKRNKQQQQAVIAALQILRKRGGK